MCRWQAESCEQVCKRGCCPVQLVILFDVPDNTLDLLESLTYLALRFWFFQATDTEHSATGAIVVEMRLLQVRQGHPCKRVPHFQDIPLQEQDIQTVSEPVHTVHDRRCIWIRLIPSGDPGIVLSRQVCKHAPQKKSN